MRLYTMPDDAPPRAMLTCYPELLRKPNWFLWLAGDIPGFSRMSQQERRAAALELLRRDKIIPIQSMPAEVLEAV